MSELTPEEFTQLVLIAAGPPNRVGEVVARLVGEHITIGPIAVGPGGMGSATAWGTRGQVHVATVASSMNARKPDTVVRRVPGTVFCSTACTCEPLNT